MSADPAVGADHHALGDGDVGSDPAARRHFRPGLNQGERSDLRRRIDGRAVRDERRRVHARTRGRRRVEQGGHPRPPGIGFCRMIGTTPAGTRASMSGWMITAPARSSQRRGVAPIVQEAYLVRACRCKGASLVSSRSVSGAVPPAASATVAIECGPLRVKKRASQIDISAFSLA